MRKFNLECYCENTAGKAGQVHGGRVVLRHNKVYIDSSSSSKGHAFEGFYIAYPDPDRPQPPPLGLVSTISKEPPMLNWIYVDKTTREVKYGNRTQSRQHSVGSWGWDAGKEGGADGLTLEGKEGAVAIETRDGWELRWEDKNGEVGCKESDCVMISLERKFLELTIEEKREQCTEEERTDTQIICTNSNLEKSRNSTGRLRRYRKKAENGKQRGKKPQVEITSTTAEKPAKPR